MSLRTSAFAKSLKTNVEVSPLGDVNKDGFIDFYFAQSQLAGYFALSDGREHFQLQRGPGETVVEPTLPGGTYNYASQLIDYDNDGLLDLVTAVTTHGEGAEVQVELRIWRNTGDGWVDVSDKTSRGISSKVGPINQRLSGTRLLASGDIDGDGDDGHHLRNSRVAVCASPEMTVVTGTAPCAFSFPAK